MGKFQPRVETALHDTFNPTAEEEYEIKQIAEQAAHLRSILNEQDDETLELTTDFIVAKMEERTGRGPKWAWNNWAGTAAAFGIIPTGYQVQS